MHIWNDSKPSINRLVLPSAIIGQNFDKRLRVIPGGRCLSEEERIKARIVGILKDADRENDQERKDQFRRLWVAVAVAVLLTLTTYTLVLLLSGLLRL